MDNSVTLSILNTLYDNNIHPLQDGRKILWQFYIFMEIDKI